MRERSTRDTIGRITSRDRLTVLWQSVQSRLETESVGDPLKSIFTAEMASE